MDHDPSIAYFTMEIGLASGIPTYAGGLGVLAGDAIRAAADMGLPMAAVSLLHREGYFRQRLDAQGRQSEEPVAWRPEDHFERLGPNAELALEGRPVRLAIWRRVVRGLGAGAGGVPVYLLDTDLPENDPDDRAITRALYSGDARMRLRQEAVLGIGGVRALRALGHLSVSRFHMNEGHAALLALELLDEHLRAERGATSSPPTAC